MLVTAIIPTYNRAALLREALESVFAQTHKELQIVVVDDGSTDDTASVLSQFADKIQSVRLEHSGIGATRNRGIDLARGQYIAFLDSDDLWDSCKLEHQLTYASAHPELVASYTDATEFNENGVTKSSYVEHLPALKDSSDLFTAMVTQFAIPLTSTFLIKASYLTQTGLRFPEHIEIGEDIWLFTQILKSGGRLGYLPEALTMRRMHSSNISGNHCQRFEQRKQLYQDLLSADRVGSHKNRYTPEQISALKFGLRDACYRVAECDWEGFKFSKARRGFCQALHPDLRGLQSLVYATLTLLPPQVIAGVRRIKSSA